VSRRAGLALRQPAGTPTYDSNGNLTADGFHAYAWDADGNMVTVGSVGLTYDALDRMVEQNAGGSYTQLVYGPNGNKLALMNGQTLFRGRVPLPGGVLAIYWSNPLTLVRYWHSNWQGSGPAITSSSQTMLGDEAYAPYGEQYAENGGVADFTGQWAATEPDLYDFLYREYHPTQGRWLRPDPAGLAAVDPSNPQSWNRYAYVTNNPLALIDPTGLGGCPPGVPSSMCVNGTYYPPGGAVHPSPTSGFGWNWGGLLNGLNTILAGQAGASSVNYAVEWSDPTVVQTTVDGIPDLFEYDLGTPTFGLVFNTSDSSDVLFTSFASAIDNAYGQALSTAGQYFRGRPPGMSFGACVGQNMSWTFTFSPNHPISTSVASGAIGVGGVLLGGPTFGGGTLAARLAIAAKVFLSAVPEDEAAESALMDAAFAAADAAAPLALAVGGVGLAPLVGSAANCASVGVAQ